MWVIDLENGGFYFGPGDLSGADYQSFYDQIASLGNFVEGYFSIGHNSLDNYIAQVSGQAPNPQTQEDCPVNTDWEPPGASVLNPLGQAVGQGCLLPANVPTLGDQLDTAFAGGGHATWKGYMEGMGTDPSTGYATTCAQGGVNGGDASSPGAYAGKHDPFIWFHGIIDSVQRCDAHVVPLSQLPADLSSVDTTPNFSWITPTLCNDGHDCGSAGFQPWLEKYLPIITSSPAYRQDGMIVLTYDEQAVASIPGIAPPLEVASCCNEIPGPNAPNPGVGGPGGGIVGAIVLSPFVEPATFTPCTWPSTGDGRLAQPTCVSGPMFNHYSALRTFEDLFGITSGGTDGAGHIGYAATPNPGHFGCATSPAPDGTAGDVFDGICPPPYDGSPVPPLTTSAVSGLTGPRPADGAFTWQQTVNGNDLNAVSCAPQSPAVCVAVGKVGTVLASVDAGATWHAQPTALARNLNGVSCDMSITCVAVGDDGVVLTRTSSLGAWQKQPSPTNGDLSAVSCAPESAVCVAVGRGGVVIGSAD
ncbi:MAG: hypothetical protein JOY80_05095, partial [Candidatus Dormibacteraeota bacterium]|nr:hypothetical protein [Candidatus Dormibacteraeota bacterium]